MTREEIERLEAIENEARSAAKAAGLAASEARKEFARQELASLGVVFDETVVSVPKWGFESFCHDKDECLVLDVTGSGEALVHPVSGKGKPHAGRRPYSVKISSISLRESGGES